MGHPDEEEIDQPKFVRPKKKQKLKWFQTVISSNASGIESRTNGGEG